MNNNLKSNRQRFEETYGEFDSNQLQKEMLFNQRQIIEKLEKIESIRSNISKILWLMIIPIILSIVIGIMTLV